MVEHGLVEVDEIFGLLISKRDRQLQRKKTGVVVRAFPDVDIAFFYVCLT